MKKDMQKEMKELKELLEEISRKVDELRTQPFYPPCQPYGPYPYQPYPIQPYTPWYTTEPNTTGDPYPNSSYQVMC